MPRIARTLVTALLAVAAIASVQARPSRLSVLPGTVMVTEGTSIPPGSILRVNLHDLSPGIAKDATVAKETFEAEGKTPIHFELFYNQSAIEPTRLYAVAAVITDSRGQALWETRVPIRVLTLGNQKKVQLVLRPVERPKAPPEPTSLALECDGLRFHVDLSPTSATVVLQDSKVVLPITETYSGKRYSDGATTLAVSGSAAYFQRPGKAYRDCKVRPEPESEPKP
jgi:putative lipoprotein